MATRSRELSARKAAILHALVQHYIRTGEPVGSEVLAGTAGLGVSSATIRSELSALEELGYLSQPHTSAGRAPTDLAYRFFVDTLPLRARLREPERRAVVQFFDEALADVDEILRGTTQLLSRLTRYASLALAPNPVESPIVRSELVSLGSATLLLVVFETGRVEKRLVEVPEGVGEDGLERLSRTMAELFRGKTLKQAKEAATTGAEASAETPEAIVLEGVSVALDQMREAGEVEHVVLGGVANIAAEEAFHRRETLRQVYEVLERESAILRLLREAAATTPISVTIGRENSLPDLWEASVIAAPYAAGGATGTIGVVGPTRMDYGAAISAVRVVAERLSAAVEALRG